MWGEDEKSTVGKALLKRRTRFGYFASEDLVGTKYKYVEILLVCLAKGYSSFESVGLV